MRSQTKRAIRDYFTSIQKAILWPSGLTKVFSDHRQEWNAYDTSAAQVLKYSLEENLLKEAVFKSDGYRPIIRYLRGQPSPYELALSLRRNSFLCHRTAVTLHKLGVSENSIYVNQEQAPKPSSSSAMTQESIGFAFRNQPRKTNFQFSYGEFHYVLISGKSTGQAGVIRMSRSVDENVDVTDLERTLIDIVVRPQYSGGIKNVLSIFTRATEKINIDHLIRLLKKLDYVYPYHQAIGFLLERAGAPSKSLAKFAKLGMQFDFYLDYGMKRAEFDRNWRLYYPHNLGNLSQTEPGGSGS